MPVTIESLLEENVGKIQTFHEHLEKLKDDMELFPTDDEFAQARDTYKSAVDQLWSTSAVLGVLDGAFTKSEQEIEGKLTQLENLCDAIETKVTATEKSTGEIFAQLDAGFGKLTNTLENKQRPAAGKLLTMKSSALALKKLIDTKEQEFVTSVQKYVTKADEAFRNLETRRTTVIGALDEFTTKGDQLMDGGKSAMEAMLTHLKQQLEEIHSAYDQKIKSQIETAAAEEESKVKQQLQQSIDETKQQVQEQHDKVQDAKAAIETEAAAIEKQAEQATESIEEADAKLQQVKSSM